MKITGSVEREEYAYTPSYNITVMSVLQFIAGHFWSSGMEAIFRISPPQLVWAQPFIAGVAQHLRPSLL